MGKKALSLVDQAKLVRCRPGRERASFDEQKFQLVLAYLRGEVRNVQCAHVLGVSRHNLAHSVGRILSAAFNAGRLVESDR